MHTQTHKDDTHGQLKVQHLAKRYLGTWSVEAGECSTDLLNS